MKGIVKRMNHKRDEEDLIARNIRKAIENSMEEFSILDPFPPSWLAWNRHNIDDEIKHPEWLYASLALSERASALATTDKMRWASGFCYRGTACVVTLQKFGLRLYISGGDSLHKDESSDYSPATIRDSLVAQLQILLGIVEKNVLIPLFREQRTLGEIVIRNDYFAIRNMYEYFRTRSLNWENLEAEISILNLSSPDLIEPSGSSVAEMLRPYLKKKKQLQYKGYFEFAAILAFFSLLEHVLVLLKPMSIQESQISVNDFIGLSLTKKWVSVFGSSDQEANRMKDDILKISDRYRNFYAHGGVAKGGKSAYVSIPGLGMLSSPDIEQQRQPSFPFIDGKLGGTQIQAKVFPFFDKIEAWLESSALSHGMKYIKEGLNVSFENSFREEILSLTKDDQKFDQWLEMRSQALDRFLNFED